MNCSSRCNKSTGLLILRLLIGWIFLYHGITKIPMAEQAAGFIGGAFHNIGLTFLSMNMWFWILVILEITAGALFVLGVFTRIAAAVVIVIMLGAMNVKGWSFQAAELDFVLAVLALGLAFTGNGAYSLQNRCCRMCSGSCASGTPAPKAKK